MPNPNEYLAKKSLLDTKQDLLTAGTNITIDNNNVISAAGGTEVEANPQDPATDTLTTIDIDGTVYDIAGSGGSSVIPNPSDPPTDTLDSIEIDGDIFSVGSGNADYVELTQAEYDILTPEEKMNGTIYFITDGEGGGGSGGDGDTNVYGAFIDTNRVIKANTTFNSDTSYTATEDCAIVYSIAVNTGTNGQILVDGKQIAAFYSGDGVMQPTDSLYLKAGQTILFKPTYSPGVSSYTVYGLTFGTQNIFTPQIYSTEEREIGVWIDNKPLYAKSYNFGALPNNTTKALSSGLTGVNVVNIGGIAISASGFTTTIPHTETSGNGDVQIDFLATNEIRIKTNSDYSGFTGYVTLYYTKTTDTAGSGSYNTLGVPMVHYSTNEQVVGTWIDGKPLYQKVMYSVTQVQLIDSVWTNIPWVEEPTNIDLLIDVKLTNNVPNNSNNVRFSVVSGRICGASTKTGNFPPTSDPVYVVFQYTKTTD